MRYLALLALFLFSSSPAGGAEGPESRPGRSSARLAPERHGIVPSPTSPGGNLSVTLFFEPAGDPEGIALVTDGSPFLSQGQWEDKQASVQYELNGQVEEQEGYYLLSYSLVLNTMAGGAQGSTVARGQVWLKEGEPAALLKRKGMLVKVSVSPVEKPKPASSREE